MPESHESYPTVHVLVPRMQVASGEEVKKLLSDYGLTLDKLPKIRVTDPSLIPLGPKVGDVIKITRVSPATGKDALYYRLVVD